MAHRSPNCPQITFQDAAERGRKVFAKEKQHPTPKDVVAQDLGYSGLNGRSLSMIGALRQYGLLEGSGEGLRVSDDAVAYFVRDDGPEKSSAIERMVYRPALFSELHEQFGDSLPSDGNLKHILIQKGFSTESADDVIRVYKANSSFVESNGGYNTPSTPESAEAQTMQTETRSASTVEVPTIGPGQGSLPYAAMLKFTRAQLQPPPENTHTWDWTLSVPRGVNANLTIYGELKKSDLVRLKKQIEFLEESFDDETEEAAQ